MTIQERIEQTDKIAQAMCGFCTEDKRCVLKYSALCSEVASQDCTYKESAEELIHKGYGKVSEYKAEIERLRDDYAKLQEQFAQYQMASDKEITAQVKQAKIDILNEVKKRIYDISPYNPLVTKDNVKYFIEKLIEEVQNGKDIG